ncbi:hypothetical protein AAFC00_006630 [Neodothiora populina]
MGKDPNREGGPRASLALLGAFTAIFCTVGFINAFGVFQEYYQLNQLSEHTPFDISWLGSFTSFAMFLFAIPAGILMDRIGPIIPITVGSVAILLGVFMTSLCHTYWQFFLAQALLLGTGIGFVATPSFAVVPRYFKQNRALAMGVTIGGSSLGGIIWPIMLNRLLNHTGVGFGWTLRIVGFVMLPLLAVTCLTIRLPLPTAARDPIEQVEEQDRATDTTDEAEKTSKDNEEAGTLPVWKNTNSIILCAAIALVYLGFFGPFFYVSSYAVSIGQSSSFSFYLIAILNAASLFGRILPGIVADRYGSWNLLLVSMLTSSIVAFCMTAATSTAGIIVWSLAYGFASGAILSLQSACAVSLVKPQDSGKAIGMVMGSASITGLFGSPICGQLVQHYGYLAMAMFTGSVLIAGGLVEAVARFRLRPKVFARI